MMLHAKGRLGESPSSLLGSLLMMTGFELAGTGRREVIEKKLIHIRQQQ